MPVRKKRLVTTSTLIETSTYLADQVTNLREDILIHRLNYSLTTMDEEKGEDLLNKAVKALEK